MMNLAEIVGIIAEYHPFHNGHLYQMRNARAMTGASYCVVVLSGHFVQRGMPAIYSSRLRAEAALRCGADAVFEIPSPFSSASARDYARFAVSLLSSLGIQQLSCGTEDASSAELSLLTDCISEESPIFQHSLQCSLKDGLSFPEARLAAILDDLRSAGAAPELLLRTKELLMQSNNILALEYAHAIRTLSSELQLCCVERKGSGYHDPVLHGDFASATALRGQLLQGSSVSALSDYMPQEACELFSTVPPLSPDRLCAALERRILNLLYEGRALSDFADVSGELAARIAKSRLQYESYETLVNALKTRQYTHTRIARALTHIFLGITKEQMQLWKSCSSAPYARLLGFRRDSAELLSALKEHSSIPIISKAADAPQLLSTPAALSLLQAEAHAAALWNSLLFEQSRISSPNLYEQQIVIV